MATRLIERSEGRRLFDILRSGDILVVRWLDRLGRNYTDVTDTVRDFLRKGVVIRTVINNLTLDGATKDPMQAAVRDALIGFLSAMAQAQAEATRSAQSAGIAYAKAEGRTYLGRKPTFDRAQLATVIDMLAMQQSVSAVSRVTGLSRKQCTGSRQTPLVPSPHLLGGVYRYVRGKLDLTS